MSIIYENSIDKQRVFDCIFSATNHINSNCHLYGIIIIIRIERLEDIQEGESTWKRRAGVNFIGSMVRNGISLTEMSYSQRRSIDIAIPISSWTRDFKSIKSFPFEYD